MKVILFANTDWYLWNFRRLLVQALVAEGFDVLLLSPPGEHVRKLESLGVRWVAAPLKRTSRNPLRELHSVYWMYRFLRQEAPDLVHGFTLQSALQIGTAARLLGVKRVAAVAGVGFIFTDARFSTRLLRVPVRLALRFALGGPGSRVVFQNSDDQSLFVRENIIADESAILIPSSGIDLETFSPPPAANAATGEQGQPTLRVLLPARLIWDKGVGEYVDAARSLRREGLEAEFLLAGTPDPGNPRSIPESTVRAWHAEGAVNWLGHVDDMAEMYRKVDIVVLPSYGEGLPRSLAEAAASGCPLITSDSPGCRDVVVDERTGLIVPVRDAGALAEAIRRLAGDASLRQQMGEAGRKHAAENFDAKAVNAATLSVYRSLCAKA